MKTKNLLLGIAIGMGFSVATVAQNVPNYVPTNGLVGWWPFNGNANDESGNGYNGTVLNGTTLSNDRFGNSNKAYYFDGIDDVITIDTAVLNASTYASVSFWFQTNDFTSRVKNVWNKKRSSNGDGFCFWIFKDSCLADVNRAPVITPGQYLTNAYQISNIWNHGVVTYNNGILSFYINGMLGGSVNSPAGSLVGNQKFYVGKGFDVPPDNGGNRAFKGLIDDIGIWNRVLTQQEISDLYTSNICYQNITVTDTLIINTNLVGFNPVTYQNSIKIFPNPTNDHITINYGNYATLNNYQLRITNSLGQQMFQTTINQQSSYINLSNWTGNGIYFVHLIDPQGNTIDIRKIVLQ
jgi:hypothetical protein